MENSKLAELLRTLNPAEMAGFRAYLRAFHANEEAPLSLFAYLEAFFPAFKAKELEKPYIEKALGLPPSAGNKRVSNEGSKLYGWLLDFLAWQKFRLEENKFEYYLMLMKLLQEKKLEKEFRRTAQKASTWLEGQPAATCRPLQRMQLAHQKYYQTLSNKLKPDNEDIGEAATQLQHFYYTSNLKYWCELRSRSLALQEEEPGFERFGHLEAAGIEQDFVLARLYSLCGKLLKDEKDEDFERFYEAFFANEKPLDKEDEHIFLGYMINFAARRLLQEEQPWQKRAFQLYQYGLGKGALITDGYLSDMTFHNIVHVACGLGELGWAKNFAGQYAGSLVEDGRDSTISLALARIEFEQSNFEGTLELLRGLEFKNYAFAIQAKLLQVRCFYETGADLAFDSLIKSYDTFLSRNKVINKEATLAAYRNFLKILKMLAAGNHSRKQIEAAIDECELMVCKSWLKRKLQSLPE